MTPQQLKNSILQLAIQGKLVEQIPSDGTAEELYTQVQNEKRRLIAENKIKKSKPSPAITEDEIPFDIPESWKWVHFCDIAESSLGKTLNAKTDVGEDTPYLCSINVYWDGINLDNVKTAKFTVDQRNKYMLKKGDLLVCEGGDAGRSCVWNSNSPMWYQNALHCIRFYGGINSVFYKYVMELYKANGLIDASCRGVTIKHFVQGSLYSLPIPLPSLNEQNRIVDRIHQLFKLVDRYGEAWSKLEAFNQKFPEDMKKSILQQAIQGKLVEQRAAEGTAEELYNQIQAEKKKLVAKKIIKKDKALDIISDDEIPFDIPTTWKWVRIGDIFTLQAGKNISASSIFDEYSAAHPYLCFGGNGIRGYVESANRNGIHVLIGRQGALCGNVKLSSDEFYATEHAVVVDQYEKTNVDWAFYFLEALNLNQYATATAQPGLAVSKINNVLIPLPPFEEQVRIVNKIEKLLPLCDSLIK